MCTGQRRSEQFVSALSAGVNHVNHLPEGRRFAMAQTIFPQACILIAAVVVFMIIVIDGSVERRDG
jgi:hypothetical protein